MLRAVLVPVKSFGQAKHRLAPALDDASRRWLARRLAQLVIAASAPAPAWVVCDDDEVADFALDQGASVLFSPGLGLSGAVSAAVSHLALVGVDLAVVAHGDLPFAESLGEFGDFGAVTLAPDLRHDGTNVAAVPTDAGFAFAYGTGSFERHRAEAARLGLAVRVVDDERLAFDVDRPEDLAAIASLLERRSVGLAGDAR